MAEIDLQAALPGQDPNAHAVFEIHLQPGEVLIWADRANPKRLASYYFRKPLLYGSIMFVTVIVFFVAGISDGFSRTLNLPLIFVIVAAALFMGSLMFVWEAVLRQAWRGIDLDEQIRKGTLAPQAAGVIHTDFEKGFIRAETISYQDFVALNGESGAKEAGKMRLEGKEYSVHDGDVMHFRFAN